MQFYVIIIQISIFIYKFLLLNISELFLGVHKLKCRLYVEKKGGINYG